LCRQGKLTGLTIKFKQILHVTSSNNRNGFSSVDEETFSDSSLLDSLTLLRFELARDLLAATDRRGGAISPLLHLCLLTHNNKSNGQDWSNFKIACYVLASRRYFGFLSLAAVAGSQLAVWLKVHSAQGT
jgi:hypothetical protein